MDNNKTYVFGNTFSEGGPRVEERLSRLIEKCADIGLQEGSSAGGCSRTLVIPEHKDWLVTMWHFGVDSITEYTGDKFSATWEVGQNALIRAYSKDMKEQGRTIRFERQEYPNKSFVDAIEEKLQNESSILKNEGTLAGDSSSCFVRDDSDSGDGD